MHHNIFVNTALTIILSLFAASCVPKIDIDSPAGRSVSVAPAEDGNITVQLVCNSNIKDNVRVSFHMRDYNGIHTRGDFTSKDTITTVLPAAAGQIQIAFRAVKLKNFIHPSVFSRDEGVTFNVAAIIRTPSDGACINWSGMYNVSLSNSSEFWKRTFTAVNDGLPGETPGTGTTKYLNFMVGEDEYGPYGIRIDWKYDNLFAND